MIEENDSFIWSEKYRPNTIEDCILPETVKNTFKEFVKKGEIINLLLSGNSGTGKTTVAKALCKELGCDYIIINGSEESGIDTLRTKIRQYASSVSLSGGRKVIIIDEADYMNANSLQPALRGAIEEFASNASFIFTCNFKNRIIDAIQGRCTTIDFALTAKEKMLMATQFLSRLKYILKNENIEYDEEVLIPLILKYFPNYRKTINELQKYSSSGKIDSGILAQIVDVDLKDLILYMKEKDFSKTKEWVSRNSDNDPSRIYRRIYDGLIKQLKSHSVPQLVLILAKYQYQHAFVADGEINLLACMVEILLECEFN
jgi:DNA polymerase III delta prime subunit